MTPAEKARATFGRRYPELVDELDGFRERIADGERARDERDAALRRFVASAPSWSFERKLLAELAGLSRQRLHRILEEDGPDAP